MSASSATSDHPTELPVDTPEQQRARSITNRRVILVAAVLVVVLSLVLSLGEHREQVLIPLLDVPLPPMCAMKAYVGVDCPGCGLTRSFIALGHGRVSDALAFNSAGPLWFALVAVQIPWQWWQLRRLSRGQPEWDAGWWGQSLIWVGLAALIVQWVVRQLG